MADRRMLARTITENDNFVALPAAAQALYMHLTLSADDDGFCSQISTAMFRAHAKKKDLEALVEARYLIRFPNGVIVIKHWRMANSGRADRYTPTVYQEEYQQLTIKSNKSYTMAPVRQPIDTKATADGQPSDASPATKWQPSDNQSAPQKRREENRREERNNITPAHEDDDGFEAWWETYPRKSGEIRGAYLEYVHALETGATKEILMEALKWQTEEWNAGDARFIPSPEKWLKNRRWLEKRREPKPRSTSMAIPPQPVGTVDMSQLEQTLARL